MNQIGTNTELIPNIRKLQEAIKKATNQEFKFIFMIKLDGKVVFDVPRGFILKLRDKNQEYVEEEFTGKDFSEAIKNFCNFFLQGTEGRITYNEGDFHFNVQFHYKSGWVASDGHCSCAHFNNLAKSKGD